MLRTARRRRLAVAAALLVPSLVLTGLASTAGAAPTPSEPATEIPAGAVVFYSVQAAGVEPTDLAQRLLAAGLQADGRDHDGVTVMGNAATRAQLEAIDGVEIVATEVINPVVTVAPDGGDQDAILPKRLDGRTYETYYGGYRTVDAFDKFLRDVDAEYPEMAKQVVYGESYTGDNDLDAICITADAQDGCKLNPDVDKARFMLVTHIHARELTTSEVSWRFITHLLDGYQKDADVTALLDSTEVWLIPHLNPDGLEVVQEGIEEQGLAETSPAWQRKNLNPGDIACGGTWAFSHRGVDLNRNYPSHWGGAGTDPNQCGQTWPGEEANSEPETADQIKLIKKLFRDQRGPDDDDPAPLDATGALLSLHTAANLVLFPWGFDADIQAPNDEGLRSYAFRASYYNGYETGQPGEVLYEVSGSTDDWSYEDLGIASGTWELGPGGGECGGFHPAYTCQDDFFELNLPALMYQAIAARTPYEYSLGPTVLSAKAKGSGGKTTVTIKADDAALGTFGPNPPPSQNVTQARIFLDKAPWDGGTAKAMKVKGSGKSVTATVKVKKGGKQKLAWTQARDAQGNWGAVRAVWIPKK